MKTVDEMLNLALRTSDQRHQTSAWIEHANSPEAFFTMSAALWQAVERAGTAKGVDDDFKRPTALCTDNIANGCATRRADCAG
ncbi:hypothetical protein [Hydrogenophaga sp. PAMC20947]|uniref:hypothetical protein n=1 Tax=Hydrogenophaga sp. PAMC20947 TaxID=2565558 RepID=UPI00109DF1FE|nr:hypothetical protein [Hydrogenophaga sp. PAMC20947]QCB47051.1 hypothetical protein E5678_14080 [Hydrogenophaga sp. PAMC20947]